MATIRPRDRGSEMTVIADQVVRELSQLDRLESLSAERLVDMASLMGDFLANRIRPVAPHATVVRCACNKNGDPGILLHGTLPSKPGEENRHGIP